MNIHLVADAKNKIKADIDKLRSIRYDLNFTDAIIEYLEECLADCDDENEESDD